MKHRISRLQIADHHSPRGSIVLGPTSLSGLVWTPNSGPQFWDGRYLGAVVESALRSRRITSKELGHVIMCAYGAPRAGICHGRASRDITSPGQCLTCSVPASHFALGTVDGRQNASTHA